MASRNSSFLHLKHQLPVVNKTLDLSSILSARLNEEDGPNAVDDLEALAADRKTPSPEPTLPAAAPSSHQSYRNTKRAKRRAEDHSKKGRQPPKLQKLEDHVLYGAEAVTLQEFDSKRLPAASGAYSSLPLKESIEAKRKIPEIDALLDRGFEYVAAKDASDGINSARPFIDSENRIFSVYAGFPFEKSYLEACKRLCEFIRCEQEKVDFDEKEQHHNRGDFPSVNFGISQGNGKQDASRLKEGKRSVLIQRMRGNPDLQRIASFQDSALKLWAPKLYDYYWTTMSALNQEKNFEKSVFACATMNFGPRVRAFKHRDMLNLAFGWCAITALGEFDSAAGGHLILWEPKLIVEFPAGSTCLIPSSCITHSNIATKPGEWRASFTQYSAGGIFRWVENGFKTDKVLLKEDGRKYDDMMEERKARWSRGLEKYSTLDELLAPCR